MPPEAAESSQEDPYQLRLFGKSAQHLEVVAAEFLPHDKDLFVVVGDAEGEMHIFQFDPHSMSFAAHTPFQCPCHG